MHAYIMHSSKDLPKVKNQGFTTPSLGVLQIMFDPSCGTTDVYLKINEANHLLEILGPVMAEINAQAAELAATNVSDGG